VSTKGAKEVKGETSEKKTEQKAQAKREKSHQEAAEAVWVLGALLRDVLPLEEEANVAGRIAGVLVDDAGGVERRDAVERDVLGLAGLGGQVGGGVPEGALVVAEVGACGAAALSSERSAAAEQQRGGAARLNV